MKTSPLILKFLRNHQAASDHAAREDLAVCERAAHHGASCCRFWVPKSIDCWF